MAATVESITPSKGAIDAKLARSPGMGGMIVFGLILAAGMFYAASHLVSDLSVEKATTIRPFIMLGGALLIALGFEFVNGFHDTANAVATVIYTHSLEPHIAVAWSGLFNFAGVLLSTGAVAFGVLSLLPVELILQVGSAGGFAMVFALLVAAMIWNLGTWYLGLPASSSHTLIGSIIGVGIANQLMAVKTGTSGVDWGQAANIGKSLLVSPLVGFALAAALLLIAKAAITDKRLYEAPEGTAPPPFWIRGLLILTCTAVSFAHGSNDGQKHGSYHADSDRPCTYSLRAQSRRARKRYNGLCRGVGAGRPGVEPACFQRGGHWRSTRRGSGIYTDPALQPRHRACAAPDRQ